MEKEIKHLGYQCLLLLLCITDNKLLLCCYLNMIHISPYWCSWNMLRRKKKNLTWIKIYQISAQSDVLRGPVTWKNSHILKVNFCRASLNVVYLLYQTNQLILKWSGKNCVQIWLTHTFPHLVICWYFEKSLSHTFVLFTVQCYISPE